MKRLITLLSLVLLPVMIFAQTSGKLSGVVRSADGTPLAGANVVLEGTTMGAATDANGQYYILNVPVGRYSVRADYIGYQTNTLNDIRVSVGLTTNVDFSLAVAAVEGEEVIVTAEKPLVVLDATTTTKIIDTEAIQALPLRNLNQVVALQSGVVGNAIRGSRTTDNAYYVDGVLLKEAWTGNALTAGVSQRSVNEVSVQQGGQSAEYGNANGGVVVTTSRFGGNKFNASAEFLTDIGTKTPGTDANALYSYGHQILNFDLGGPLGDNIRYYFNIENEKNDDQSPARITAPFADVREYQSLSAADSAFLFVNGDSAQGWNDGIFYYQEFVRNNQSNTDSLLWAARQARTVDDFETPARWLDTTYVAASKYERLYGPKRGYDNNRLRFAGNIVFDFKPFRFKIGGLGYNFETHNYGPYGFYNGNSHYHLLNWKNYQTRETEQRVGYINATYNISPKSFLKATGSYTKYYLTDYNPHHKYDTEAYGKRTTEWGSPNYYYVQHGQNPSSISELASVAAHGAQYWRHDQRWEDKLGIRTDYVNQIGNHELTAGFEYYDTKIKWYRINDPHELYQQTAVVDTNFNGIVEPFELTTGDVDEWRFAVYRNMYVDNLGFNIYGDEVDSYKFDDHSQEPGNPVNFRAYLSDKLEYKDLVINLGMAFEYFNSNAYAPDSDGDGIGDNDGFNKLHLTNNRIDRSGTKDGSLKWEKVETHQSWLPRLGFAFPVTDRTVFRAQYGNYMQNVPLQRLYLSDSDLSANLSQGNYTNTPNPTLAPERTTSYEVGFTQQVGQFAALDVAGFYKEVRDYVLSQNRYEATRDGADFVWAQYQNGDFGTTTGFQFNLRMRRINGFLADLNYALMWARGTGTNANSNYYINWLGSDLADYPSIINPLDFDQRHTASLLLDWRSQQRQGLLSDVGVNAIFTYGSGQAYTPSRIESDIYGKGNLFPVAAINSGSLPATARVDLKFDKAITVGGLRLNLYTLVLNAFNRENATNAYAGTGLPGDDGWLSTASGKDWVEARLADGGYGNAQPENYYLDQIQRANRYGIPRTVRFGVQIEL